LDTGALALGAMPDGEATSARAHVDTCESCTAELTGFLETAALLGSAAAETPPASLRASIMALIAVTPQLPPLTGQSGPANPAGRPAARHAADDTPDNVVPLRRWYRRPGALVAAAIAAVVLGGGTVVAINQVTGQGEQTAQTPEQCVAQAADKQQLIPEKGQGTATYAQSCNAVMLDVSGLPGLPADRTYQLWAIADNKPRSVDLLADASAGKQQIVTAQTNPGESIVAITAEPAGGSAQPTTDIVWAATLT
jgi:hypothetical protein